MILTKLVFDLEVFNLITLLGAQQATWTQISVWKRNEILSLSDPFSFWKNTSAQVV